MSERRRERLQPLPAPPSAAPAAAAAAAAPARSGSDVGAAPMQVDRSGAYIFFLPMQALILDRVSRCPPPRHFPPPVRRQRTVKQPILAVFDRSHSGAGDSCEESVKRARQCKLNLMDSPSSLLLLFLPCCFFFSLFRIVITCFLLCVCVLFLCLLNAPPLDRCSLSSNSGPSPFVVANGKPSTPV